MRRYRDLFSDEIDIPGSILRTTEFYHKEHKGFSRRAQNMLMKRFVFFACPTVSFRRVMYLLSELCGYFFLYLKEKIKVMKKYLVTHTSFFLFICLLFSVKGSAQMFTNDELKAQMVADWQRAKVYTTEYLNTMPANKYGYRYKAVDSLRSFAQQMLHLATANVFLMATATDQAPLPWASFGLEKSVTAQTRDSVVYYVNASYDYAMNAVKNSDPAKWKEIKKLFGFETTRFALMQKTFEHQTHHRGQTTIYIRMNDIAPPQEKLF